MAKQPPTRSEVNETIVERLDWQVATRDDQAVAEARHEGEELDAVYPLGEVGLLDAFYHFLESPGILREFATLQLPRVQRVFLPVIQDVLLSLLKTLLGIEAMNALPVLLFSNVAAMTGVPWGPGFNAHQVAEGLTRRGDDQRTERPKQGPLSPQCLAQNIGKFTTEQMEKLFNAIICLLVGVVGLTGELPVALDGSTVPTTKTYPGCGCLSVTDTVKEKKTGRLVEVGKNVFGWKILVRIEGQSRLPLAMTVVQIQEYEGAWLLPLRKQAQTNLGERARIRKGVIERGDLDGEDLWQVDQLGITFVIVAKAGMTVREDAHAVARDEKGGERVRRVRHGHGKNAWGAERGTCLVGSEGLTTDDADAAPPEAIHRNRAAYLPQRLNAVVVRTGENREYPDGGIVYLTKGPVQDPFVVFDDDDWRRVIENGIFQEGKHPWHLPHVPQRTKQAVLVHCFFTLTVMALGTAFRLWKVQAEMTDDPDPSPPPVRRQRQTVPLATILGGEGIQRWRRRWHAENRDKVIVFVGDLSGIFPVSAFAVLAGLRIKADGIPPELGSPADILAHYGLSP